MHLAARRAAAAWCGAATPALSSPAARAPLLGLRGWAPCARAAFGTDARALLRRGSPVRPRCPPLCGSAQAAPLRSEPLRSEPRHLLCAAPTLAAPAGGRRAGAAAAAEHVHPDAGHPQPQRDDVPPGQGRHGRGAPPHLASCLSPPAPSRGERAAAESSRCGQGGGTAVFGDVKEAVVSPLARSLFQVPSHPHHLPTTQPSSPHLTVGRFRT